MWIKTVMEGGRRFMATWRKEGEDAASFHKKNRQVDDTIGRSLPHRGRRRTSKATRLNLVDEPKGPCAGTRWVETAVTSNGECVPKCPLAHIYFRCSLYCTRRVYFYDFPSYKQ